MALNITQGPLPADGQSVDPATFLEAWISNTVITNLDASNFDTGEFGLSFVISQTDAPASSVRNNGMFWYERGAGRLWVWDVLDAPSSHTVASDFDRYHGGNDWICLSNGREHWLLASKTIPKGAVCYIARDTDNVITTYSGSTWIFASPGESARAGHAPLPARMYWLVTDQANTNSGTADITEICWIAKETGASGTLFRGQEFGWVEMLAHSGTTGSAAYAYVTDSGVSESSFLHPGAWITQSTNPGRMFVCTFTDSSATSPTDVWLRSGFKQHFPPWGIARERV